MYQFSMHSEVYRLCEGRTVTLPTTAWSSRQAVALLMPEEANTSLAERIKIQKQVRSKLRRDISLQLEERHAMLSEH